MNDNLYGLLFLNLSSTSLRSKNSLLNSIQYKADHNFKETDRKNGFALSLGNSVLLTTPTKSMRKYASICRMRLEEWIVFYQNPWVETRNVQFKENFKIR